VTGESSVLAGVGFDLGDLGRLGWLGVNTPGRGPGEQQKKRVPSPPAGCGILLCAPRRGLYGMVFLRYSPEPMASIIRCKSSWE
jgi:hypothetical protein